MSRNRRRAAPRAEPSAVNGQWNLRTMYYREELFKKLKGLFEIKCPEEWDRDYMLDLLLREGVFAISNTVAGVLPLRTSTEGINYMNYATDAVINVPTFKGMVKTLNKDAVLIYLQRAFGGNGFYTANAMVDIYAEKLASADCAIDVNLMNSRVGYAIEAETKAQAETIRQGYSDLVNGEPLVVFRKGSVDTKLVSQGMNVFFNSVKNNFIADIVQDEKNSIMNEFWSNWGINNANTDKKERLIVGEVDANNDQLECSIYHFKKVLEQQNNHVHECFPDLEWDIKFKFDALNRRMQQNATMVANKPMGVSPQAG